MEINNESSNRSHQDPGEPAFVPKGAIAFFGVMICFYIFLWMVFYFIMLGRH